MQESRQARVAGQAHVSWTPSALGENMISITNDFIQRFKLATEQMWKKAKINQGIYGFQFQPSTKWIDGLNDNAINEYEKILCIQFPEELKIILRNINGTDLPTINIFGNSGEKPIYSVGVYSYPKDLKHIQDRINNIKEYSKEWDFEFLENDILFPFYIHRYFQIRNNEILRVVSIYDEDGIIFGNTVKEYLENEFQLTTAST